MFWLFILFNLNYLNEQVCVFFVLFLSFCFVLLDYFYFTYFVLHFHLFIILFLLIFFCFIRIIHFYLFCFVFSFVHHFVSAHFLFLFYYIFKCYLFCFVFSFVHHFVVAHFCFVLCCLFYSACVVSDDSTFYPKFKGKPNNKPWFLCENVLHTYACTCTVIYLFVPYMMQWRPVFDCKIFLCHITFSFSEDWAFFPVKSSPPVQSVSQSHSFSLSFSGPSSPFLTALCLITSYLKWQLTSWGCNGGWLTEKEQQNTHTHTT